MPVYEYACEACTHQFEELILNGRTDVQCPQCAATRVRRRLSSFSFSGASAPAPQDGGCGRCGSDTPGQCQMG